MKFRLICKGNFRPMNYGEEWSETFHLRPVFIQQKGPTDGQQKLLSKALMNRGKQMTCTPSRVYRVYKCPKHRPMAKNALAHAD